MTERQALKWLRRLGETQNCWQGWTVFREQSPSQSESLNLIGSNPQFAPQSFSTPLHQCLLSAQLEACWFGLHMRSQPHNFFLYTSLKLEIAKWVILSVPSISTSWVTRKPAAFPLLLCILTGELVPTHTLIMRRWIHAHARTHCFLL